MSCIDAEFCHHDFVKCSPGVAHVLMNIHKPYADDKIGCCSCCCWRLVPRLQ